MHRLDVGDVRIYPLVEIDRLAVESTEFFPDFDIVRHSGEWFARHPFVDCASGELLLTIRTYLLRVRERVILLDCGIGNDKTRVRPAFNMLTSSWLEQLCRLGLAVDDVDTVILSHLHVDHVGWATSWQADHWAPTFPRAQYVVDPEELRYWRSGPGRLAMLRTGDYLADSIDPVESGQQLYLNDPEPLLPPEIRVEGVAGHTPGSTIVRVLSRSRQAVLSGDVLHHPLQCARPAISSRYCCDPSAAASQRETLLARICDDRSLILPAHFSGIGVGRIERCGSGYRYRPADDEVSLA